MSTSAFFRLPETNRRLHAGPLGIHIDAHAARLLEEGYLSKPARVHLRIIADFSRWLQRRKLGVADIDAQTLQRYVHDRRHVLVCQRYTASAVGKITGMLRDQRIISQVTPQAEIDARARAEEDFKRYLAQERGLSPGTQRNYLPVVRRFLRERFGRGPVRFSALCATDITGFVLRHVHERSPRCAQKMVVALRAFLRYLRYCGEITTDLAACVPTVPNWSLSTLPKFLKPGQVQQVLAHCNRYTSLGRRNYAILLLLARLGLRAGEVVAMMLDDIDWRAGHVTLRGKGGRWAQMPLPEEVGTAIAAYLQEARPRCASRRLFIRERAPRVGFANHEAISTLVRRALTHAGVDSPHTGAHVFRHTLATEMLRHGASLGEIGELLRHQHPDTTQIYAKVDVSALRPLALRWPGDGR